MTIVCDGTNWHVVERFVLGSRVVVNPYASRSGNVISFTNVAEATGSDIVNGGTNNATTFTIAVTGWYQVSVSAESASALAVGVTKTNTSGPASLTYGSPGALLAYTNGAASVPTACSNIVYLASGDVIRVCTNGVALSATAQNGFTIARVG